MNRLRPTPRRFAQPAGMTLLEVLVACGILVMGLASVAAMLPAAGARLADATAIDRGGTMSANGFADLSSRGVSKAALFSTDAIKAVVLGNLFTSTAAFDAAPFRRQTSGNLGLPTTVFELPDSWQLGPNGMPVQQPGGVCFFATLARVDDDEPVAPGTLARLSIAALRKSSAEARQLSLTRVGAAGSGVFRLANTNTTLTASPSRELALEGLRKKFAPGCQWVLAVPPGGDVPRWLRIGTSWTTVKLSAGSMAPDVSYVCFTDAALADQMASGNTLSVWGFSHLLRVDERTVSLE